MPQVLIRLVVPHHVLCAVLDVNVLQRVRQLFNDAPMEHTRPEEKLPVIYALQVIRVIFMEL